MNDIEIIKEKLKIIESLCTDDCINKSTVIEPLKYAIENVIKENENYQKNIPLELLSRKLEELKKLEDDLMSVYLNGFYDGEQKWKNKIKKELEEEDKNE